MRQKETAGKPKKSLSWGITLVVMLFFLGYGLFAGLTLFRQYQYQSWRQDLIEEGPWGRESVWVADHGEAYLVSRENAQEEVLVQLFYSRRGHSWVTCSFELGEEIGQACFYCEKELVEGELTLEEETLTFAVLEAQGRDCGVWDGVELHFTCQEEDGRYALPFDLPELEG